MLSVSQVCAPDKRKCSQLAVPINYQSRCGIMP
jgi:hypothetical protein